MGTITLLKNHLRFKKGDKIAVSARAEARLVKLKVASSAKKSAPKTSNK